MVNDYEKALEDIVNLGCERILTSGLDSSCLEGTQIIKKCIEQVHMSYVIHMSHTCHTRVIHVSRTSRARCSHSYCVLSTCIRHHILSRCLFIFIKTADKLIPIIILCLELSACVSSCVLITSHVGIKLPV